MPSAFHPHIGGVEELALKLAQEQLSHGMTPGILTNRWPRNLSAREDVGGLQVRRVPFRVPGRTLRHIGGWMFYSRAAHRAARAVIEEWQSDVLHVQCVSSNAPYALAASRRLGIPLVVTAQGELSMDANRLYQRSSYARSTLCKILAYSDVITGCSRFVLDELDAFTGGRFSHKMRVIYNGIALSEYGDVLPYRRARPYVLGLGRLVPQKGYDMLVRAFYTLQDEYPDVDLVIAGDGPDHNRLARMIADFGLEQRVDLIGAVDHSTALRLYAGAEAFVLCSVHEPQGIVILESMASNCPVIASRVGGVPEIVDGNNGLLFRSGDQRELASCLRTVLSDRSCATSLRHAGLQTAKRFTWPRLANDYLAAYLAAGA